MSTEYRSFEESTTSAIADEDRNRIQNSVNASYEVEDRDQTSTWCNSTYVVEPMAFIQNLANGIMNISCGQFIYHRILDRLIDQAEHNSSTTTTTLATSLSSTVLTTTITSPSNQTDACGRNSSNHSGLFSPINANLMLTYLEAQKQPNEQIINSYLSNSISYNGLSNDWSLTPDDMNRIRTEAQSETAHLYFIASFFSGLPVILMTILLGVNCSMLGRKTLLLFYLSSMSIKFALLLAQSIWTEAPDWLYYVGEFTRGMSGSYGIFYLSMYCYISDSTSTRSRSFRITFLNLLNSMANLFVMFIAGYVIKWSGYVYLFLAATILMFSALVYAIVLIPEPLVQLKNVSLIERLKSCSIKRTLNCFTVYFNNSNQSEDDDNERERLIKKSNNNVSEKPKKQTLALLMIVLANFIYNFGTMGISDIFNLYIMNAPFCFDSVQISHFTVFSIGASLLVSLLISKFIHINDILICIFSVASYFGSLFCYIFGNSTYYIYIGSLVNAPSALEYFYARSIISKSVDKSEVSDALSLILIVDTVITVVASIVFQLLYSKIVASGVMFLFWLSSAAVLLALICHIVNFFIYVPVKEHGKNVVESNNNAADDLLNINQSKGDMFNN